MQKVFHWRKSCRFNLLRYVLLLLVILGLTITNPVSATQPLANFSAQVTNEAPNPETNSSTTAEPDATANQNQPIQPQLPSSVGNAIDGYPVSLDGDELFRVKVGYAGVTAEERADIIEQRVMAIANASDLAVEDIRADIGTDQSTILAGQVVLFTIGAQDSEVYGASHPELADVVVTRLQTGIGQYREERSVKSAIKSIIATVISTIVLILFLRLVFLVVSKSLIRIQAKRQAGTLFLRIQSLQILGPAATSYLLSSLLRLLRLGLVLIALYLYVPFVLRQFPSTRKLGDSLLGDTIYRLEQLLQAFVAYLPNLAIVVAIAVVTYYVVQFANRVIEELGRPDVYPWFYPEWIQPTIRLAVVFIVAIAIIMSSPYLPGVNSPAFQGVSLFIGALLTLGSSSAVANALAGIILIYTRAFQLGDFIRIDDIIGTVEDKSLFVTRLRTPKQETVTIPNASVLNNNVINYSAICRESNQALLLHTTVTLGYDVPWLKIYEALIAAARATKHLQAEPEPFVLQTSLNDYNVSYQLNAYTLNPEKMPRIYSELHQNIQDKCNEVGIEILSPSFSALRDGNHSTIPEHYLPENYESPGFVVKP